jgi:hypothetical protein
MVARRRQPNHLGCVRPMGRFGARQAQNRPKMPPERPKKRIAGGEPQGPAERGAPVWFDHRDPCGPPGSDGILSAGAPRVGRCLPAALGHLHLDLGAKMENAPNPKQAASRHQLGPFQPHRALREGRLFALTGPTRAATSRSLRRKRWVIRATRRYFKNYDTTVSTRSVSRNRPGGSISIFGILYWKILCSNFLQV